MSEPIYQRPAGLTDAEWEVAQREAEAAWQRMKGMGMGVEQFANGCLAVNRSLLSVDELALRLS